MQGLSWRALTVAAWLIAAGCGDDDADIEVNRTSSANGNAQTGEVGEALPAPLRVIVTDLDGAPVSGINVNWSTDDGGSFDPNPSVTAMDGIAETVWTLGGNSGGQAAEASVNGAPNRVEFSATAGGLSIPTVNVTNNSFSPDEVTIVAGGQVHFLWASGAAGHNVVPASGNPSAEPTSGGTTLRDAGFEFTATFPAAGTFRFYCNQHGSNPTPTTVDGMSGTVTVN